MVITRNYSAFDLMETMGPYEHELKGFHPEEWLADEDNVCLTDGHGNFTLFERMTENIVYGHYFLVARGREALDLCRKFLAAVFDGPYGVEIIMGLTPLDKKGALWMNRKLGFKSLGIQDTIAGECDLVRLTRKEYE